MVHCIFLIGIDLDFPSLSYLTSMVNNQFYNKGYTEVNVNVQTDEFLRHK